MSEAKAVLAHEFGHFGQRSMKIGSYVYIATHLIYHMVTIRDRWDNLVYQWSQQDLRIAVPGWVLRGMVWCVRQLMIGMYQLINLANASLSRQMEFNADLVAVSVSGSDAIITGLYKSMYANELFNNVVSELKNAHDHQLQTKNLYAHLDSTLEEERKKDPQGQFKAPPALEQGEFLFSKDDKITVSPMYLSHPSNFDREQNAKKFYIEAENDERSAWLLFGDKAEELKQWNTQHLYEAAFPQKAGVQLVEPEELEAIKSEVHGYFQQLQQQDEVYEEDINRFNKHVRKLRKDFLALLEKLNSDEVQSLALLKGDRKLGDFLLDEKPIRPLLVQDEIDGQWLEDFLAQIDTGNAKLDKIAQKSWKRLLNYQESLEK